MLIVPANKQPFTTSAFATVIIIADKCSVQMILMFTWPGQEGVGGVKEVPTFLIRAGQAPGRNNAKLIVIFVEICL